MSDLERILLIRVARVLMNLGAIPDCPCEPSIASLIAQIEAENFELAAAISEYSRG